MSRKRARKQLTTHVSPDLAEEVGRLATAQGVSVSAVVEVLLGEALRSGLEHQHGALLEAGVERTIREALWQHLERLSDLAARAALYGDEGRRMTFQVLVKA